MKPENFYSLVPSPLLTIKNFFFIRNRFYRLLSLIVVSFLFSFICNAAKYYVSSTTGNDTYSGTSTATPWKSLTKVNSFIPQPGDEILFKRGDKWIGTITVNSSGNAVSPIVYGAYGEGDKPKIYGSEVITGWQLHAGNIYKATFNTPTTQIFVNGVKMKLARLTNTGYNTVNAVTSQTQFSCDALNAGFNYTGARVMLRTENWYSIMRSVTSSNSKTLTIDRVPQGTIKVNQGFLLMNKLEFLDSPGEWYYDAATKTVYLWAPNGAIPANYEIRGSVIENGVYILNQHYITIQDLNILQQKEKGFSVDGNNIIIENNQIEGQEGYGIYSDGGKTEWVIQNNKFDDINGLGINLKVQNSIVRDNEITNIGVFDKLGLMGTAADNGGTSMEISGDGNTIEYNRIIGANYNGIMWRGNAIIRYNFINDVLLTKSDGGAIYTGSPTAAGSYVAYNIIDNAVGNQAGGTTGRNLGEGIYLDEPSSNITAEYNTVTRCSDAGIFLHRTENHVIKHNTVFDTRIGFLASRHSGTVKSSVTYNLFVVAKDTDDYDPRQLALSYSGGNAIFDNNIYVNGFTSNLVFKTPSEYLTFEQWKAFIGSDDNSTYIDTKLAVGEKQEIFYNATKIVKTFHLNGVVAKDVYGVTVSGTFTLQPFTSIILRGTNLNSISEVPTGFHPALMGKEVKTLTLIAPPETETDSSITILWDNSVDCGNVIGYNIFLNDEIVGYSEKTNYTISGLQPDCSYKVKVLTKGHSENCSTTSNLLIVKTKPSPEIFNITDFGAISAPGKVNTEAIQRAIDACSDGGMVYIPEGEFVSGALFLKSNMTLYIAKGGILRGSSNHLDYLPLIKSRFEGWEVNSYSSLITAGKLDHAGPSNIQNISIRGEGEIAGGGEVLGNAMIKEKGERSRGRLICLMNCENVNIQGLTIKDSPCWTIHYIYSKNVTCNGLKISSKVRNGDGIDPDSSKDSYIFNCSFITNDDCIAIKSGKNPEGNKVDRPCENIYISNCHFIEGHSVAIGSEISGGIKNVVIKDCQLDNLWFGIQVKTTKERGGYVDGLSVENCNLLLIMVVTSVPYNNDGESAPGLSILRNFSFKNLDMTLANTDKPLIYIDGFNVPGYYIHNISFTNIKLPEDSKIYMNCIESAEIKNVCSVNGEIPDYKISKSIDVDFK